MSRLTDIEWKLLQNSSVNLYKSEDVFEEDCKSLQRVGYRVCQINCDTMLSFKADISLAFEWENQFGYPAWDGNMDALNDAMSDTTLGYKGRFTIACKDFHKLVKEDKNMAMTFLDLLEYNSREHLLESCLFIGLIQTNDSYFCPKNLGCRDANWNYREWLTEDRVK